MIHSLQDPCLSESWQVGTQRAGYWRQAQVMGEGGVDRLGFDLILKTRLEPSLGLTIEANPLQFLQALAIQALAGIGYLGSLAQYTGPAPSVPSDGLAGGARNYVAANGTNVGGGTSGSRTHTCTQRASTHSVAGHFEEGVSHLKWGGATSSVHGK